MSEQSDAEQRCREVGHLWVKPMMPINGEVVDRICYRCGVHGLGDEKLATIRISKVYNPLSSVR